MFPWIEDEKNAEMSKIQQIITDNEVLLADELRSVIKTMQNILNRLGVQYRTFLNDRNY